MRKYVKKPVLVEAVQLMETRKSIRDCLVFMGQAVNTISDMECDKFDVYCNIVRSEGGIFIKTLESDGDTQLASLGDYVIKGVSGEFYPCKPDIFKMTYFTESEYAEYITK